ncbi:heterokaryon incompatibility protein [Bimuria novae-zelandiae CBS 107.79]|uniref:Heterokaryon incompatibility protein n=1 Tax=Bimuria novae-zelandiae CBS 107.79 TaxID=1447943 RepID=A0A6A5VQ31_9PLEO|nr:heterokaryon incompatibility protein [Bimuria novae-zelandiae CBS 107.79]
MGDVDLPTTYEYTPLPSPNHIRLLHTHNDERENGSNLTFSIVTAELPTHDKPFKFETVSYTWGAPKRVSSIAVHGSAGVIGLTQNLTQALPELVRNSKTGYLWIDQLCINQSDPGEKAHQVSIMSRIYKAASRVLVWLGPEDDHSVMAKQWLNELEIWLAGRDDALRTLPSHESYSWSIRMLVVRSKWVLPDADPKHALAARRFWGRRWFRRGWVCQELLLSREVLFLAGTAQFSMQDLSDLQTLPPDMVFDKEDMEHTTAYNTLMTLKRFPFTGTQPLRFLQFMAQVASEFETTELVDRLCAFLGMLNSTSTFVPDYTRSVRYNYTAFAVSLDFLSLWSAIIDAKISSTPEQLKDFPSWVPSWTWLPLLAPCRLAAGATRAYFNPVTWNAAASRRHSHDHAEDAVATERLHVRGRIIDRIARISSAKIDRYFSDADPAYLDALVAQIKSDLPGSGYDTWTRTDLVHFLNTISANGSPPKQSAEDVLSLVPKAWGEGLVNNAVVGYNEALSSSLSIGRGRRFVVTEQGRRGMVPFVGSRAREGDVEGPAVVVVHGCCVPIVLERGSEEDGWVVVGDCYVKGAMHGEVVTWDVGDADTFVLV